MKAIYGRVSIEEQSTKGYGLKNQIDECKKKIGNDEHLMFIDEGISGEVLTRPGLTELREAVAAGVVTEIICYDPDRLSRKLMHQLMLDDEFHKKGVTLTFVNGEYAQTPEGQLFKSMRGAISEFEKEKIKQRTLGGKLRKAREGKVLGNYGLYGYDYDSVNKTYKINEEQAKIVKMIFDYFTEPTSRFRGMNGIAKHLTDIGIPTAKNKGVWHRNVVRQILMNESYTGRHAQNKTNDEGNYVRKQSGEKQIRTIRDKEEWIYVDIPRIISDEQYERAQDLLSQSRRRYAKESLNTYLLSGLLRCKDCGNTMVGHKANWWGSKVFIYSDRKNSSGAKNPGCGNDIRTEKLETDVWEHVVDVLNNPEKIAEHRESDKIIGYLQSEAEHVQKEIEKIKKGRQRLVSLVAISEDLDLTEISKQLEDMQTKEKTLQIKYSQIEKEIKSALKESSTKLLEQTISFYINKKDTLTYEDKKYFIRTMVKQIYLSKDHEELDIHLF